MECVKDNRLRTISDIESYIRTVASKIAAKKGISEKVLERVADTLIQRIRKKYSDKHINVNKTPLLKLSRDDINVIGDALVIGDIYSYQTWLHRDNFNSLIFKLNIEQVIQGPFLRIPQQIRRMLILQIDRRMWKPLKYIYALSADLSALKINNFKNLTELGRKKKEEEEDYLCSFIASAALFGKILFPGFENAILRSTWKNISLSPVYIEIPLDKNYKQGSNPPFYRYFLPAPASNYLLRYLLFIEKHYPSRNKKKDLNAPVFEHIQKNLNKFPYIFEKWTIKRLNELGFYDIKGLSIRTFRKAALLASAMSIIRPTKTSSYPPFILSIQTQKIISDSVPWKFFMDCPEFDTKSGVFLYKDTDYGLPEREKPVINNRELSKALKTIQTFFRDPLKTEKNTGTKSSLGDRKSIMKKINSLISSFENLLPYADYENLKLYSEWIADMLVLKRTAIKTISNYVSNAKDLLLALPGNKPVYKFSQEELTQIIKQILNRHLSPNIIKGLKSFLYFVEARFKGTFESPKWKNKELRKKSSLTVKPLIHFEHVSAALDKRHNLTHTYLNKYKGENQYEKLLRSITHKSEALHHMVHLGFYTGLRAGEFAHLRIQNVVYDTGYVLCIRTTKTENGLRNIPLSLLLPTNYMEEFISYYEQRKRNASTSKDLLFPGHDGKPWDTSYMASEVRRLFEYIGIRKVRFHYLRHAFANWFLLRWFVAFYPQYITEDIPFLKNELFQEPHITNFKKLFIGMNNKKCQESFTYALAVLARLIGHGGPLVTLQKYIHIGDWLFFLLSRHHNNTMVDITSKQAQDFLQVSYPTLPEELKGRSKKTLSYEELLYYQRLKYLKNR
jgi:integrase